MATALVYHLFVLFLSEFASLGSIKIMYVFERCAISGVELGLSVPVSRSRRQTLGVTKSNRNAFSTSLDDMYYLFPPLPREQRVHYSRPCSRVESGTNEQFLV